MIDPFQDNLFESAQTLGKPVALSVSAAVELINQQLFSIAGPNMLIEGEVSEFSVSQGKWVRFTLKDLEDGALLKCFLTVYQLQVEIENGDKIIVGATPKVYPRYGQLTLNVNTIEIVGAGALAQQLERLRKKLEAEGLFAVDRKRALPLYPEKIGLIASRESAAYSDFLRILQNRWGGVEVQSLHVAVQGERAVPDIVGALGYVNQLPVEDRPDVLVLTRGGGSLEDLAAFNDEQVVRSVFASVVPIVVGIGHERDESLAEYAADVRASTPSNAAERVVPDKDSVLNQIEMTERRLVDRVQDAVQTRMYGVESAVAKLTRVMQSLAFEVNRVMTTVQNVGDVLLHELTRYKERVEGMGRYLKEMDPVRVLSRGYAIVHAGDAVLKDASKVGQGDTIQVQLAHGTIRADVQEAN